MINMEEFAGELYDEYCEKVGGVNFKGDPLPSWEEFRGDATKKKQSDAWVAVATHAFEVCT